MKRIQTLCRALFFILLSFSAESRADTPLSVDLPGPFATEVIEFYATVDRSRQRSVPMKVHLPKVSDRSFPVIILSHGGGGNWDANFSQAEHLASYGYAVICLEHVGSNTAKLKRRFRLMRILKQMTRSADEVLARPKDVSFAIDTAEEWNKSEPRLRGRLDLSRIGILGHSFGAYTTLVVCGARPALDWLEPKVKSGKGLGDDLSDARVKACVALSPQGPGEPFFIESSYESINRPVLGMTGSKDVQQDLPPSNRKKFFELIPPGDKVFFWLENADHLAFSDSTGAKQRMFPSPSRNEVQPIVRAATLLFFNAYLRDDVEAKAALTLKTFQPFLGKVITDVQIWKK